jgi:porphobilinogen deaminase
VQDGRLSLRARVADPEGVQMIDDSLEGDAQDAPRLGAELAQRLLRHGASGLLEVRA